MSAPSYPIRCLSAYCGKADPRACARCPDRKALYDHRRLQSNPSEYVRNWLAVYLDECHKIDVWTADNVTHSPAI